WRRDRSRPCGARPCPWPSAHWAASRWRRRPGTTACARDPSPPPPSPRRDRSREWPARPPPAHRSGRSTSGARAAPRPPPPPRSPPVDQPFVSPGSPFVDASFGHGLGEASVALLRVAELLVAGGVVGAGEQQGVAVGRAGVAVVLEQAEADLLVVGVVAFLDGGE